MRSAAAIAAAVLALCLSATGLRAQRRAPAPRARSVQSHPVQGRSQAPRGQYQSQQRGYPGQQRPYQQMNGRSLQAPGFTGNQGAQRSWLGQPNAANAARPAYAYPGAAPPGHLGDWLNRHPGLPLQQQEQLLRRDPSFNRLAPATQQRLVQQLHQLDQMPQAERERRLARSEMLEHMSPQEQMQVRQAGRRYQALPANRQAVVKQAFRDLRSVPLDQRDTVINSQRYQSQFSPDERNILSNLLRAEPYRPPQ